MPEVQTQQRWAKQLPAHEHDHQQTKKRTLGAKSSSPQVSASDPDRRTTMMLRNMPNNYTRSMVVAMLDKEGFNGDYNFLYLPIDFQTHACLGYAFVNLCSHESSARFLKTFNGYSSWVIPSRKLCGVGWSQPLQGLIANIERYRNSPIMHESVPDGDRPLTFFEGKPTPFPAPTKNLRAPRIRN